MPEALEIGHRIKAARELRGVSQEELAQQFDDDGLGSSDVGRLERGLLALTRARRDALVRHLRVPERWFTSENVDEIVGYEEVDAIGLRRELEAIRHDLEVLLERRANVEQRLQAFPPESIEDAVELLRALRQFAAQTGRDVNQRSVHIQRAMDRLNEPGTDGP